MIFYLVFYFQSNPFYLFSIVYLPGCSVTVIVVWNGHRDASSKTIYIYIYIYIYISHSVNALRRSMYPTLLPSAISRLCSLILKWQPVREKENPVFKPVKFGFKTDFLLHPARKEGLGKYTIFLSVISKPFHLVSFVFLLVHTNFIENIFWIFYQ